ncbi:MAG: sulfur-oxidizing protein SoxX [Candidatus Azotimanducaceae bacterium]|jgi:sulfur-oxidizing protein SoxX
MQEVGSILLAAKCLDRLVLQWLILLASFAASSLQAADREVPLTEQRGRAEVGETIFNERNKGHCLLCHQLATNNEPFQGNIGPRLDGVGSRLSAAQIRYRIVDPRRLNKSTVMPAYYSTKALAQVAVEHRGKTILTGQEVEDLVAYLVKQL